jgi:hypothetical protein
MQLGCKRSSHEPCTSDGGISHGDVLFVRRRLSGGRDGRFEGGRTISHGGVRLARRAWAVADRPNAQAADCATIQEMRESPSSSAFVPPTPVRMGTI